MKRRLESKAASPALWPLVWATMSGEAAYPLKPLAACESGCPSLRQVNAAAGGDVPKPGARL